MGPKTEIKTGLGWVPEGSLAGDFRPGFPWIAGRVRPPVPPSSSGPTPHINFHEKSAPKANYEAIFVAPKKSRQAAFRYPGVAQFGAESVAMGPKPISTPAPEGC